MEKIRFVVTVDKDAGRDGDLEAMQVAQGINSMYPKPVPDEFVFDTWAEVIDHLESLAIERHSDTSIFIACRINPTGLEAIPEGSPAAMSAKQTAMSARPSSPKDSQ